MARFYGAIGYAEQPMLRPGVAQDVIRERMYYGDVLRNMAQPAQQSENLNDDLKFNNQISVLADAFALENFYKIRYVQAFGCKWKVTSAEVKHPRLILQIGGVYNDPTDGASCKTC